MFAILNYADFTVLRRFLHETQFRSGWIPAEATVGRALATKQNVQFCQSRGAIIMFSEPTMKYSLSSDIEQTRAVSSARCLPCARPKTDTESAVRSSSAQHHQRTLGHGIVLGRVPLVILPT